MRTGFALTIHRFAPLARRTPGEMNRPVVALVAGIFFTAVFAAQAQESVEPDVLPSLAEPPASSAQAAPPASPESSSSSAATEPLPSATNETAPLPSAEEAFPSSREPLSPSTNYTTAQTSLV